MSDGRSLQARESGMTLGEAIMFFADRGVIVEESPIGGLQVGLYRIPGYPELTSNQLIHLAEFLQHRVAAPFEEEWDKCPACKGRGTVNPLTAPPGFFCFGITDCPKCDGTGLCP